MITAFHKFHSVSISGKLQVRSHHQAIDLPSFITTWLLSRPSGTFKLIFIYREGTNASAGNHGLRGPSRDQSSIDNREIRKLRPLTPPTLSLDKHLCRLEDLRRLYCRARDVTAQIRERATWALCWGRSRWYSSCGQVFSLNELNYDDCLDIIRLRTRFLIVRKNYVAKLI